MEKWIVSFLVVTSHNIRVTVRPQPDTGNEPLKPSEMQLLLRRCPVCLYGRGCWGAMRPTTPDPSPRGKRELLLCRCADGISRSYLRKACLCDWLPCQCSLKTLFKLVKLNTTLSSYWTRRLTLCFSVSPRPFGPEPVLHLHRPNTTWRLRVLGSFGAHWRGKPWPLLLLSVGFAFAAVWKEWARWAQLGLSSTPSTQEETPHTEMGRGGQPRALPLRSSGQPPTPGTGMKSGPGSTVDILD